MNQPDIEQSLTRYLPSMRQAARHMIVLTVVACLLGPLLGPVVVSWFNPSQAWGAAQPGYHSAVEVMLWGLALLMFEAFFYAGWLIFRARKGWREHKASSWELR